MSMSTGVRVKLPESVIQTYKSVVIIKNKNNKVETPRLRISCYMLLNRWQILSYIS